MRIYELAKELGVDSKELQTHVEDLGIEVKNHMSAIDTETVELLKEFYGDEANKEKTEAPVKQTEIETVEEVEEEVEEEVAAEGKTSVDDETKVITVNSSAIVIKDLATLMGKKPNVLIAHLMQMNILASINQALDIKSARKVAEKLGYTLTVESKNATKKKEIQHAQKKQVKAQEDLKTRSPIVTFLGHVDHGKTSLLDNIRQATVASGEHGGITQHIGAYTVEKHGNRITFLDTPGHAAFTAMRARGAHLTDIAVIIIAADDGIMPQTKEAIAHAKAADVELIVAINKIDLPSANVDQVKIQLQSEDLLPEDWGGQTICVPVSAQTGEGIDTLLEMILLQAEVLELRANPQASAEGYVVEAKLEQGIGPTASLLVKNGTLKIGDALLCGEYWGKVRALIDDHGNRIKKAGPSTPVKCLGLSGVPQAGEKFTICKNDKEARSLAKAKMSELKMEQLAPKKMSLEDMFAKANSDENQELNIIIKSDTRGSAEAIVHSLDQIKSDKVSLKIIHNGTGNITSGDVLLASASNAVILGFHVSKEPGLQQIEKREGVEIQLYHIIYELIDKVKEAMTGMVVQEYKETITGHAKILQIFQIGKRSRIAGCYVTDGTISSNCRARVKRNGEILFEGAIDTIKHFQETVKSMREGQECGIKMANFDLFEPDDIVEAYEMTKLDISL
jgi:translation initiation factor IF-2